MSPPSSARTSFPAPTRPPSSSKAFLTFGLGFVARPIGGIVIGRMGDTHGRKSALMLTIFLMAAGTVLIGILPTYATIGVAAPALLLFARLMQGFSAGGEWGGSTAFIVEWAPQGARPVRQLPADERRRRPAARLVLRRAAQHRADAGADGRVGLAHPVPGRRHPGPDRHLHAPHHRRDAALREDAGGPAAPASERTASRSRRAPSASPSSGRSASTSCYLHAELDGQVHEPQRRQRRCGRTASGWSCW